VAEFGRVFGDVMSDHLRAGRIAIPISGGLDSRTTVATFDGDGSSPDTSASGPTHMAIQTFG